MPRELEAVRVGRTASSRSWANYDRGAGEVAGTT